MPIMVVLLRQRRNYNMFHRSIESVDSLSRQAKDDLPHRLIYLHNVRAEGFHLHTFLALHIGASFRLLSSSLRIPTCQRLLRLPVSPA